MSTVLAKTAPCPRCGSNRTSALVKDGQVVDRGCANCLYRWDVAPAPVVTDATR